MTELNRLIGQLDNIAERTEAGVSEKYDAESIREAARILRAAASVDGLMRLIDNFAQTASTRAVYQTITLQELFEERAAIESALRMALAEGDQAKKVCAEAYQVVGSLLFDAGRICTPQGQKVLDNLGLQRMVHDDVLPWETAREDDVFAALDMSPDTFRTEGGAVNVGKLRAAIRHPADYLPADHWLVAAREGFVLVPREGVEQIADALADVLATFQHAEPEALKAAIQHSNRSAHAAYTLVYGLLAAAPKGTP